MGLEIIEKISHKYGSDPCYVLAGGGNTSYKNEEHLYIKGSGTQLATITADGFVKMSREALANIWNKTYSKEQNQREAEVLVDMMGAKCKGEENKRPSVETLLHNLFKKTYVLHVHPTKVNGLTCSLGGKELMEEMFPSAIWIEETEPGYTLAKKCRERINDYEAKAGKLANLLFLQNHGVFFAAESEEEMDELVSSVMKKIDEKISKEPNLNELQYDKALVSKIANAIKEANGDVAVEFTLNCEVEKLSKSRDAFEILMRPMSPDHIVYCKALPLFVENASNISNDIASFEKANGYKAKIIFVKGVGMFAIGINEKNAKVVSDVWLDAVKISVYSQSFGGLRPMAPEMVDFIANWEVESYRSKVALK